MDYEHDNPHDSRDYESREAERDSERWDREQVIDEVKDEELLQEAKRLTSERD